MAFSPYGRLAGRPVDYRPGRGSHPHFQIRLIDDRHEYRIAVNVRGDTYPSELLYYVDRNFSHPILEDLARAPLGFRFIDHDRGDAALDYVRANIVDPQKMVPLAANNPGPCDDLNDIIEDLVIKAMESETQRFIAFGNKWGPELHRRDPIFGFMPGRGLHDIHMNQGNSSGWRRADRVWQDGGLFLHIPEQDRWIALFLAFQSQSFKTDDRTGHALGEHGETLGSLIEGRDDVLPVQIVAALVNPPGDDAGNETVTLINSGSHALNIGGWTLVDHEGRQEDIPEGTRIPAGETLRLRLVEGSLVLSNKGGTLTLKNGKGEKIHGVAWTSDDAAEEGATILFS